MLKRIFDIVVSTIVLLFISPIFLVAVIAVKIESSGPVFFVQKRVGKSGILFSMYKFRSMVIDAEQLGSHSTSKNDVRITSVGKFIRKTSIDELPQLVNVLLGDMSLVGPRPNVPQQQADYTKIDWDKRNKVLPGITGLAQAKLRSSATADQRTELDLRYVDKVSLKLDIYIIALTIKQVFLKGSH